MKTPKVKKREVSVHSRAARRGKEPPSKDLSVKTPTEESDYKPWMHSAQNAGISKKKKSKTQTHAQRMRQEKALEKAEQIASRLEKKVGDSKKKSKKVQARAADWEELNGKLGPMKEEKKAVKKTGKVGDAGRAMEDVVLPDLEQPLPIRNVEMSAAEDMSAKKQIPETTELEDEVI
ncbi:hypothetical protein M409DRAFT_28149 [Zasmidium cellare ATCC 36951]|uniref:Uncharacterized protein n=1 Tax=Zasmidium cellare ATCC 36951 TaxID=1080233 RepID=A0A6A6C2R3_ZASCE|nr:uncharacterized protein M409DRAFT_28149 [Zasmidium cellare ATCC 36951]KAF2161417.1 hypothetical protein M409DRAFT_28149 [Zasmidium cellare ATCC 36951]